MRTPTVTILIASMALWAGDAPAKHTHTPQAAPQLAPSSTSPPAEQLQPSPTPTSPQQSQPGSQTQQSQSALPPLQAQSTLPWQQSAPSPTRYSAAALYNIANAYARAGKPGLAVLNYERAALLAPNDPDINANLEYVRAISNVPTEPGSRLARIAQTASPTSAAWLGVVGIGLLGAGLLTNKGTRRYRGFRVISTLLGLCLITLTVLNALLLWPRMHEAVVLVNQAPARVSPVPMGDTAFVLREAQTVTITSEHEEFVLVRTRTGRTGWVARASLGAVMP